MANYGGYGGGQSRYGESNPYATSGYNTQSQQDPYYNAPNQNNQPSYSPAPYRPQQPAAPQPPGGQRPYQPAGNGIRNNRIQPDGNQGYPQDSGIEMRDLNDGPNLDANPMAILNECSAIRKAIEDTERRLIRIELRELHDNAINDPDAGRYNSAIDSKTAQIMAIYKNFSNRIIRIKKHPKSGDPRNGPTVTSVDGDVKTAIQDFQNFNYQFEQKLKTQFKRQFRSANPEATEEEIERAADEPGNRMVYAQRLQNSNRRGEARTALGAVQARHEAIQNILRTITELAELFDRVSQAAIEQDNAVVQIEHQAEEAKTNVEKGNVQLNDANEKARAARKKKWICLGIFVLIILVIAAIIAIAVTVTKK